MSQHASLIYIIKSVPFLCLPLSLSLSHSHSHVLYTHTFIKGSLPEADLIRDLKRKLFYALLAAGATQTKQYHNVLMNQSREADAQRYVMNKRSDAAAKHVFLLNVMHLFRYSSTHTKDHRG